MRTTADVSVKLQGFQAANRDAEVTFKSDATGVEKKTRVFLDGTATVRDLEAGMYEMIVTHPNLAIPIEHRKIRVFPQPTPTLVNIQVPDVIFQNNPIADIPDADLSPVQKTAATVKKLGEQQDVVSGGVITAAAWNQLVHAVADLAGAVEQLTTLVTPKGHNHPEIAAKIDEVQSNLRSFADAFGKSILEIRRQFEVQQLHDTIEEANVIDTAAPGLRNDLKLKLQDLKDVALSDPIQYTQKLANFGDLLVNKINDAATTPAGAKVLADSSVKQILERGKAYTAAGTQRRPENELQVYMKSSAGAVRARKEG